MSDQICVRNFILYEYITRTVAMASGSVQFLLIISMWDDGRDMDDVAHVLAPGFASKKSRFERVPHRLPYHSA